MSLGSGPLKYIAICWNGSPIPSLLAGITTSAVQECWLRSSSSAYESTNSNTKEPKQRFPQWTESLHEKKSTNQRQEKADTKAVVKEEVACFRYGKAGQFVP